MDTNNERLVFRDEVFQIIGRAIEVLSILAHGIVEKAIRKCVGRGGMPDGNPVSPLREKVRVIQIPCGGAPG